MKSLGLSCVSLLATFGLVLSSAGCVGAPDELDDEETDGAEPIGEGSSSLTVEQVVSSSCTTSSVQGLSLQIIAEGNCITPGAYTSVPSRANLSVASNVFLKLETPAKNKLVAALDAYPGTTMSVTSMLRTVAQQYLLYRWYQLGTCSIGLAATPGNSNHETGLALDISNYSSWTGKLPNYGFSWLGSSDTVHFDYTGSGAVSYKGLDVKAFQRLWNRNHSSDLITVDGIWGPQTQSRLQQSPAGGFAIGAQCAAALADAEPMAAAVDSDAMSREIAVDGELDGIEPEHVCGADIADVTVEAPVLEPEEAY
jgi:hypothetical protein